MNSAGDPPGPAVRVPDAQRVMRELTAAVARQAERTRIHILAAEALMFGAAPERVHAAAGLDDLEQYLVARLRTEFAADDAEIEHQARQQVGSPHAAPG